MADGKHEYVPAGENKWPVTDLLYTWIKDSWERISLIGRKVSKSAARQIALMER
jgi:hypothetical protein